VQFDAPSYSSVSLAIFSFNYFVSFFFIKKVLLFFCPLPECHICVELFFLHQCHGCPYPTKSIGAFVTIHLLPASDDSGFNSYSSFG
jgi:hypothetical protein